MSEPLCAAVHTAYGITDECRRGPLDGIHARPEVGCAYPDAHHPFKEESIPEVVWMPRHTNPIAQCEACIWKSYRPKEEPMPKPTVTVATVNDASKGYRSAGWPEPEGKYARVSLDWPTAAPLPRKGDRVAVAGSVDAVREWIETLPAKRVIDAAEAWADQIDQFRGVSQAWDLGEKAKALHDAVRALGAPSGEAATTGDPRGDRGAIVVTITIEEVR